jgi:hypothetical protein
MSKTRTALSDEFISALASSWETHGDKVLLELRNSDPKAYAKLVAELVPRQSEIAVSNTDKYSSMSIDELRGVVLGIERPDGENQLESYMEAHLLECERIIRNLKRDIKKRLRPPPEYHSMSPGEQWRVRQGGRLHN